MIVDKHLEFSDAQAVTSTAISTKVIDLRAGTGAENLVQNEGAGEQPVYLVVQTQATATDSGSNATLTVTLESAENEALSTNAVVHYTTGAMAFADFATAGTRLAVVRLPATANYKRHLGVRYTVADGPLTAGAFDAFLTTDVDVHKKYESGFTV